MEELEYYILFPNMEHGMKLYEALKREKYKCTIVPTPRELSQCCGMSVLLSDSAQMVSAKELAEQAGVEILQIAKLPKTRDAKRDQFC